MNGHENYFKGKHPAFILQPFVLRLCALMPRANLLHFLICALPFSI